MSVVCDGTRCRYGSRGGAGIGNRWSAQPIASSRFPLADKWLKLVMAKDVQHDVSLNVGEVGVAVDRAAAALPEGLLGDDEVILLLLRPSVLYIPLASLGSLIVIGLLTFALAYLARLPWFGWTDTGAFTLGIGLASIRLGWQFLEWWSRLYILTDRRVLRRMGVLRVIVFEAPLKHIQHTSIFASLRERFFGLGTIGFATSGSDVFDAYWVMVRQPYAVHRTVLDAIRRYGGKQ